MHKFVFIFNFAKHENKEFNNNKASLDISYIEARNEAL